MENQSDFKLSQMLEAVLFYKSEPVSKKRLLELLNTNEAALQSATNDLKEKLHERGVVLLEANDSLALITNKEADEIIENLIKEDLHRDIGKAGLETLSIVIYMGPIAKSRIEYVRGVNANFILRNLLVRGLVEKIDNPQNKRSPLYRVTLDCLRHFGVSSADELPHYREIRAELEAKEKASQKVTTEDEREVLMQADELD